MTTILSLVDPIELFKALNGLSPLAVIGLLVYIVYTLVITKKGDKILAENVVSVKDNHLSDLPEMLEILRGMQQSLLRMESTLTSINARTIYIATKVNGKVLDD